MDRPERIPETELGVLVPGVDGGVKAGERSDGGGGCVGCKDGSEEVIDRASSSSAKRGNCSLPVVLSTGRDRGE